MLASRDLYQLIHQRRTMKGHKPITRIFVAILLKEANIQDGDKHLVQWLDQKRNEAFKKADEAKVNRMEVQDLSFTGFTVVYGPLVLSFLESTLPSQRPARRSRRPDPPPERSLGQGREQLRESENPRGERREPREVPLDSPGCCRSGRTTS